MNTLAILFGKKYCPGDVNLALVENSDTKNCNLRVLWGIFGGSIQEKSCLKIKNTERR